MKIEFTFYFKIVSSITLDSIFSYLQFHTTNEILENLFFIYVFQL